MMARESKTYAKKKNINRNSQVRKMRMWKCPMTFCCEVPLVE